MRFLLYKGIKNDGVISMNMANNLYSSKSSAKSAITSMQFQGYVELKTPGYFRIKKAPRSVKERVQEEQEEKEAE